MELFPVIGFLLCTGAINLLLRRVRPEYAPITAAASGMLLAVYLLRAAAETLTSLYVTAAEHQLSGWLSVLLKALAVSLSCQMTATLCRDCGEGSLAEKAELAGKVAILTLTVPLLQQLLALL